MGKQTAQAKEVYSCHYFSLMICHIFTRRKRHFFYISALYLSVFQKTPIPAGSFSSAKKSGYSAKKIKSYHSLKKHEQNHDTKADKQELLLS